MNDERRYPSAFKFAMVALMGFAVVIFYKSDNLMIRFYCVIEFVATLNGWAASEDDSIKYGDLYLLIDAICAALYFLNLLELNDGNYNNFYLYSGLIFIMYVLWNKLLEIQQEADKKTLHKYSVCDMVAGIYSFCAYLIVNFFSDHTFVNYVQYIGMVMWIVVLLVWYYDFYVKTFQKKKVVQGNKRR